MVKQYLWKRLYGVSGSLLEIDRLEPMPNPGTVRFDDFDVLSFGSQFVDETGVLVTRRDLRSDIHPYATAAGGLPRLVRGVPVAVCEPFELERDGRRFEWAVVVGGAGDEVPEPGVDMFDPAAAAGAVAAGGGRFAAASRGHGVGCRWSRSA
jgi:hypothetical protein